MLGRSYSSFFVLGKKLATIKPGCRAGLSNRGRAGKLRPSARRPDFLGKRYALSSFEWLDDDIP